MAADAAMPEQSLIERDEVATLKDLLGVLDTRTRYAVEQRLVSPMDADAATDRSPRKS